MTRKSFRKRDSAGEPIRWRIRHPRILRTTLALAALFSLALLVMGESRAPGAVSHDDGQNRDIGFGANDVIFVVYNVTNGHILNFVSMDPEWADEYVDMWNSPRSETGLPADYDILRVTNEQYEKCMEDGLNGNMDAWVVDLGTLSLKRMG